MIRFPNAKINLGLYITNKRVDGYHDLETVFFPIPLTDALEILPSKGTTALHVSGRPVAGNNENNLVWKAYHLLKEQFPGKIPELDIHLLKSIPMGAGMGGGSADGATMLRMLNDEFVLGMDTAQLAVFALQLGSDCPFFIYNTAQFATGRGEVMQQVDINLSGFSIQLICPQVHISTATAFGMITPRPAPFDLRTLATIPVAEWKGQVGNDFETPVFQQYPALKGIKEQLYNNGAVYAAMSGSGSTLYALMPKRLRAKIKLPVPAEVFFIQ